MFSLLVALLVRKYAISISRGMSPLLQDCPHHSLTVMCGRDLFKTRECASPGPQAGLSPRYKKRKQRKVNLWSRQGTSHLDEHRSPSQIPLPSHSHQTPGGRSDCSCEDSVRREKAGGTVNTEPGSDSSLPSPSNWELDPVNCS